MNNVYINQIETAVPAHEVHNQCIEFLQEFVKSKEILSKINTMVPNLGIDKRYSVIKNLLSANNSQKDHFYDHECMVSTGERMSAYKTHALPLASQALESLFTQVSTREITHILITSCTGFYSPGLDIEIINKFKLNPSIERTVIGFMGCHAAINALKLAKHIVQSNNSSKVLIVNIELSSLHLRNNFDFNQLISYLIFADGCAACIVSTDPRGLKLEQFENLLIPESQTAMSWDIADDGYSLYLDKSIPVLIKRNLPEFFESYINPQDITYWAMHPGGQGILNVIQQLLLLTDRDMSHSRKILRNHGNMSSATIMFILKEILENETEPGLGLACAFGPGLSIEALTFSK